MNAIAVRNSAPGSGSGSGSGGSGDHLRYHQEQIGIVGLFAGGGDQRVCLAAVVRLMVEEMGDEQPLRRADLALRGAAEPGEVGPEPGLVDLARPALDSRVGTDPRRAQ